MLEKLEILDRKLLLAINSCHSPTFDNLMYYISQTWVFTPLFVYLVYLVYKNIGLKKLGIILGFMVMLIIVTDQSSNQIKHSVKRYRPTHNLEIQNQVHTVNNYKGGKYGFFSGHATNSFGFAMLLFLLFDKKTLKVRSTFFVWAAIVSYSRMYLGVHYPSDILVGLVIGIFWGFMIYQLIQYTFKKQFNETISI